MTQITTPRDDGADPFVTHTNLSANALPFCPKVLPKLPLISSSFPIPGTTQHVEQIIGENENIEDFGCFSTSSSVTRNIKSFGSDKYDAALHVEKALTKARSYFKGTHCVINIHPDSWLRFSNIRDAIKIHEILRQESPEVPSQYISYADWMKVASPSKKSKSSEHEGQVVIKINYPLGFDYKQIEKEVRILLERDGRKLYASQKMPATAAGIYHLIAEFEDSSVTQDVVRRINRRVIAESAIINISLHEPDLAHEQILDKQCLTPNREQGLETPPSADDIVQTMSLDRVSYPQHGTYTPTYNSPYSHVTFNSGYMFAPSNLPLISPTPTPSKPNSRDLSISVMDMNNLNTLLTPSRSLSSPSRNFPDTKQLIPYTPQSNDRSLANRYKYESSTGRYGSGGRRNSLKATNCLSGKGRQSNGTHNMVDINRIREGADVRTTIMLRNIPNKIDQSTLKSILDETSHGKYDFAYLRIDFSNDCNVGYAFVNFIDPLHIIEFINARANQKWYRFRSQKVAEVSYATIQGRDCLIQKFRNSCVMLELPIFRPKLFYTFQDPLGRAGQEEPFPASDNPSKLRRSCENAEHVGLFAPNAGAQMRDEQRRRRSQYDRGTSLAERDSFDAYLTSPWNLDIFEKNHTYQTQRK
ncbi:BgtA-20392 [Blumeria graminis f. sp. tritici]|uniref:BgtA-20392 n=2 Tax=Blumeria graminis f. sp. tritici TaxID=62690 RepID=A0A9X9PQC7_BLUGR|nr:hypothetical protein BGT96224_A20392 [Blumeria graminis f. sp. tritici 96224]VCU38810.1 BgtA-20392 [Blumeria graminis f. sp. tritici]